MGYGKSYIINYPGHFIESFGEQFTLNHLKYPAPVQGAESFCVPWQSTMHHVWSLKDDFFLATDAATDVEGMTPNQRVQYKKSKSKRRVSFDLPSPDASKTPEPPSKAPRKRTSYPSRGGMTSILKASPAPSTTAQSDSATDSEKEKVEKRTKNKEKKLKKVERREKRKREVEQERESGSEEKEENFEIHGARISLVSQPVPSIAAQIAQMKQGMDYLDIGDDDSWMRGIPWLMDKRLSSASSTNRLGVKAQKVEPYVFKYFMTVVNAYHEVGLDNYLIMDDLRITGLFHLPLFCQHHFLSGLSGRLSEPIFIFRVLSKGQKEMKEAKEMLTKRKGTECSCRDLVASDVYKNVNPRVHCGRYWRACLDVLLERLAGEYEKGDFVSPFAYTLAYLDGSQYVSDSEKEENKDMNVAQADLVVDDEDKSSKQPTSYPPMGGMTSTGGVASESQLSDKGNTNTEIVNPNENVSIEESKTVNIVTPDPQVKEKDGIAHNIVHIKDVADMNKVV